MGKNRQDLSQIDREVEYLEQKRVHEQIGNVHAANGLVLKARAAWRVADALRFDKKQT